MFFKLFLFLSSIAIPFAPGLAQSNAVEACWRQEIDFATNQPYSSMENWQADREYWLTVKPPNDPPLIELFELYQLLKKENSNISRIPYDKQKHCYAGCRIASQISLETALFSGWQKEQMDLNDCKPESHFELDDYEATKAGSHIGAAEKAQPAQCLAMCSASFPRKPASIYFRY